MLLELHRLRFLGYAGIINHNRLPKQIVFGKLLSARPKVEISEQIC